MELSGTSEIEGVLEGEGSKESEFRVFLYGIEEEEVSEENQKHKVGEELVLL